MRNCGDEINECTSCLKSVSTFIIINASYVAETPIKFIFGKYQNQIYFFDFKKTNINWKEKYFNYICFDCLEKLVDLGYARFKPISICFKCKDEFLDEYNDSGMLLPANCAEYLDYGSKYDTCKYKFINLIGNNFYCYRCLDLEIIEKRAEFIDSWSSRPNNVKEKDNG